MSSFNNSTQRLMSSRTSKTSASYTSSDSDVKNAMHESRMLNAKSLNRMRRGAYITDSSWHGMAFLIEAVVLLAFIAVCITVFFRLFAYSKDISVTNRELSSAVMYASNTAEEFALSPATMDGYSNTEGDFVVTCSVEPEDTSTGTLYKASIVVSSASTGDELYTLTTSSYVSEVG